ncbi:MAG: phosphoribosyltransferase [Deferrisomatales bacterium]
MGAPPLLIEDPSLRDRDRVFLDRTDAGGRLAALLGEWAGTDALVLAVPAGGVPVAVEVARALELPLDVAVVSKVTLPWNPEAGYGAVAFDGTVELNEELLAYLGLTRRETEEGVARTRAKVARRVAALRGDRPFPRLEGRPALLVDDGLASGFTLRVAAGALGRAGAARVIVAVPTAHRGALGRLAGRVERVYCPNVRSALPFAVADAYRLWRDVPEEEARAALERFHEERRGG